MRIFPFFQEQASGSEAIGQIYQDEENMAAILMRRQLETGDLMMVSGSVTPTNKRGQ